MQSSCILCGWQRSQSTLFRTLAANVLYRNWLRDMDLSFGFNIYCTPLSKTSSWVEFSQENVLLTSSNSGLHSSLIALIFPFRKKQDVMSHPLMAWVGKILSLILGMACCVQFHKMILFLIASYPLRVLKIESCVVPSGGVIPINNVTSNLHLLHKHQWSHSLLQVLTILEYLHQLLLHAQNIFHWSTSVSE